MKIKLLVNWLGNIETTKPKKEWPEVKQYKEGDIVEVPQEIADWLIEIQYAEKV